MNPSSAPGMRSPVAGSRRSFPPLRSGARQHRAGTDAPQSHQQLALLLWPAWYATLVLILSWRGVYTARVLAVEPVRPGTPEQPVARDSMNPRPSNTRQAQRGRIATVCAAGFIARGTRETLGAMTL